MRAAFCSFVTREKPVSLPSPSDLDRYDRHVRVPSAFFGASPVARVLTTIHVQDLSSDEFRRL
jgi:hypothetical protein